MKALPVVLAASLIALSASSLCAQSFYLIGNPTINSGSVPTDINSDGSVVVGMDGSGGVWRWQRGVGVSPMPAIVVPGGSAPCSIHNAFVSGDGLRVVGDAGGPACLGRVYQLYTWNVGSNPTIGPANSVADYLHITGCSSTGTATGSFESFAYYSMYSASFGTFPFAAYNTTVPGCVPGDWIESRGRSVTPDGLVLGSITDCDTPSVGGVWRGGTLVTRLSQVPSAGSSNATTLISSTHRWTQATGWQPLPFIPGSVATDISANARTITANAAIGPSTRAMYATSDNPTLARNLYDTALALGDPQVPGLTLVSAVAVSANGQWITGTAVLPSGLRQTYVASIDRLCDPIDFNNDQVFPDIQDLEDLISIFSGGPCSTASSGGHCNDIDFNNDGLFPDTDDIASFISVFSGGPCI